MKRLSMIVAALLLSSQAIAAPGIKIGEYEPCQPHSFMDVLLKRTGVELISTKPHKDGTAVLYLNEQSRYWVMFLIPDENVEYMCFLEQGTGGVAKPEQT